MRGASGHAVKRKVSISRCYEEILWSKQRDESVGSARATTGYENIKDRVRLRPDCRLGIRSSYSSPAPNAAAPHPSLDERRPSGSPQQTRHRPVPLRFLARRSPWRFDQSEEGHKERRGSAELSARNPALSCAQLIVVDEIPGKKVSCLIDECLSLSSGKRIRNATDRRVP